MQTIIDLVRELLIRIKLKSPKLFIKLQVSSVITCAILGGLLTLNSSLGWGWEMIMFLKMSLTTVLGGVITFLVGIFTIASITVENKKDLTDKLNK